MVDKIPEIREDAREESFETSPKPIRRATLTATIILAIIFIIGLIMIAKLYSVVGSQASDRNRN